MKPILTLSFFLLLGSVHAQFSNLRTGLSLAKSATLEIAGEDYRSHSLGLYADVHYQVGKKLFVLPGLQFYLPKKESFSMGGEAKTTLINFYADGYYYFAPSNDLSPYILAGFNGAYWRVRDKHETAYFGQVDVDSHKLLPGVSTGIGVRFEITYKAYLFSQARVVLSSSNQLIWTSGLQVSFD